MRLGNPSLAAARYTAVMFARACLLSALIACAGCGDSMSPSDPVPNLAGTWTGQIGSPMSGSAVRVTWSASQAGNALQGIARLSKPAIGTEVSGTLSGLMTGDQIGMLFTGGRLSAPTVPNCAVMGTGSGTVSGNAISGTFTLNVTGCDGVGIESAADAPLSLTR